MPSTKFCHFELIRQLSIIQLILYTSVLLIELIEELRVYREILIEPPHSEFLFRINFIDDHHHLLLKCNILILYIFFNFLFSLQNCPVPDFVHINRNNIVNKIKSFQRLQTLPYISRRLKVSILLLSLLVYFNL